MFVTGPVDWNLFAPLCGDTSAIVMICTVNKAPKICQESTKKNSAVTGLVDQNLFTLLCGNTDVTDVLHQSIEHQKRFCYWTSGSKPFCSAVWEHRCNCDVLHQSTEHTQNICYWTSGSKPFRSAVETPVQLWCFAPVNRAKKKKILLCISWVHSQHLVRITHLNYPMSNKSLFQICFSQGLNLYLASKSNSFHCAACEKLCYNINNFCTSLDHLLTVVMLYKWTANFLSRFCFCFLIAWKLHKQSNKILSSGLHHWSFGNQPLKMNAPVTTQLFILKYSTVQYTSRNL